MKQSNNYITVNPLNNKCISPVVAMNNLTLVSDEILPYTQDDNPLSLNGKSRVNQAEDKQ